MTLRRGFSLLELLVVVALVAVFASVTFVSGRRVMQSQDELAAISIMKQSLIRAATAATSRGKEMELSHNNSVISLKESLSQKEVQRFDLPKNSQLNLSSGSFLVFRENGQIHPASLNALPQPLILSTHSKSYTLSISLIGEMKAEPQP